MTSSIPLPAPFVHLKVHSSFSLLEGALPIPKLAKLAAAMQFPAMALTDTNNLFGALEFSEKMWSAGVQPIAGIAADLDLPVFGGARQEPTKTKARIALLAMNADGVANLMRLSKCLYFDGVPGEGPKLSTARLGEFGGGLIALTGGPDGPVDHALRDGRPEIANTRLDTLLTIFGDRLYIELQRHGIEAERATEPQLLDLAYTRGIPIIATNEAYFATRADHEAHDALLCIAERRVLIEDDRRKVTPEHCLKSGQEMSELFADLPEALSNTAEIAIRCTARVEGRKPLLPRFGSTDDSVSEVENARRESAALASRAREGLHRRLGKTGPAPGFALQDYEARLAYELDVITRMMFPGYFLIVADFVGWAKANNISVGPGRGSGAGSLAAYALSITDLDPLRYGLLFERFLNPERVSMPDFDIDFCQEKRDRVIAYVQNKYGADRVAQISAHGKLQARNVLRDVGRVMQMPFGQVGSLCKLVPNDPAHHVTLKDAINAEPRLREERENDPVVARLFEIGQKLEGLYRQTSIHAAGVVIGDRPLEELVPVYRDAGSPMAITQYDGKMVEAAGLVKFDFLGLKTLTVIEKAVALIRDGRGINVDMSAIPLDDQPTYAMLAAGDTGGVFQLESAGMRESLKRLKPDRLEDIIAMVALYRPGPMENIPTFVNRKHGEEPVDFIHPMLEGILRETYGVIIYQEQVIQIAQVLSGYTLGQADLLRRAMGKKDKEEMARQQARFVDGAIANNVPRDEAVYIFNLVDKFANYGFNKSHAAAYGLVSYQTAYLKANFRAEFLAASMTFEMGNTDKLGMFVAEARKSGIEVRPPSVNHSGSGFGVEYDENKSAVRYSLLALKNAGSAVSDAIERARNTHGPFKTFADFVNNIDTPVLNKRALESLAKAGAFDDIDANRAKVAANADLLTAAAQRASENKANGTTDMFGGTTSGPQLRSTAAWTPLEQLSAEFEAVGFYLSGHPLDQYGSVLQKLAVTTYANFARAVERGASGARLAGVVVSVRERRSQKGNTFAVVLLSDSSGQYEVLLFSDLLAANRKNLEPGTAVLVAVEARLDEETLRLNVQSVQTLEQAAANIPRNLRVEVSPTHELQNALSSLKTWLQTKEPGRGEVRLVLELKDDAEEVEFILPGRFRISPLDAGKVAIMPSIGKVREN